MATMDWWGDHGANKVEGVLGGRLPVPSRLKGGCGVYDRGGAVPSECILPSHINLISERTRQWRWWYVDQ